MYDAAEREMDLYRNEITRLRAVHEAEIASLTGQRNRVSDTADELREQLGDLKDRIGNLAAGLRLSADATRPSRKTDIEDGCAAALYGLLRIDGESGDETRQRIDRERAGLPS